MKIQMCRNYKCPHYTDEVKQKNCAWLDNDLMNQCTDYLPYKQRKNRKSGFQGTFHYVCNNCNRDFTSIIIYKKCPYCDNKFTLKELIK